MSKRDRVWLWKKWANGAGAKLKDTTLRRIISAISGLDGEKTISIVAAINEAISDSWDAGWSAARGDDNAK